MTPGSDRPRLRSVALVLPLILAGCRDESEPPIVVEESPAVAPLPSEPVDSLASSEPEVVIVEERIPTLAPANSDAAAPGDRAVETASARTEEPAVEAGELTDGGPVPDDRPESAARFLPAGTRLALDLKTPLHSATTRVGDRFAARTTNATAVGGEIALERGTLVEGRVARVVSAEGGDAGMIELDFRTLVLPSGARIPIEAEIASVAGRGVEAPSGPSAGQVVGGAAAGAAAGAVLGGGRGAAIGAVLGAAGVAIVAGAREHEVVVPSGTPLEIVLTAPLENPAP